MGMILIHGSRRCGKTVGLGHDAVQSMASVGTLSLVRSGVRAAAAYPAGLTSRCFVGDKYHDAQSSKWQARQRGEGDRLPDCRDGQLRPCRMAPARWAATARR